MISACFELSDPSWTDDYVHWDLLFQRRALSTYCPPATAAAAAANRVDDLPNTQTHKLSL